MNSVASLFQHAPRVTLMSKSKMGHIALNPIRHARVTNWLKPLVATMVHYVLDEKNEQIFASRYQFHLPSEEELRAELRRELDLIDRG